MADHDLYYSNTPNNMHATQNGTPSNTNISFPDIDPDYTYPEIDPGYTYPDINGPVIPEDGRPIDPEFTYPTPPIPGTPTVPSIPNFPVVPLPPTPPPNRPAPPSCPNCPPISPQNYGRVRFLNASTMAGTVNISIDNNNYAVNSRFGTITNYDWISDGFHTVTVRRAGGMRGILVQQSYPFAAGEKTTIILVDTPSGVDLVIVVKTGCSNLPANTGCYRVANMSYPGSSFDIVLYGGDTVFRGITFQNLSNYKQAIAGSYQFFVTNSSSASVIREMPVIVIGTFPNMGMVNEPILTYQADIKAGENYTTYLIGNYWSELGFRAMTVMD